MRSLLLVADKRERLTQLQKLLAHPYTLFNAASAVDALEFLRLTKVDVVIGAFHTRSANIVRFFEQAKVLQPHCVTLDLAPPLPPQGAGDEPFVPQSDFCLRHPYNREELYLTLTYALDKQRLIEELALYRAQEGGQRPLAPLKATGDLSPARIGQILRDFAKAFSSNFDLPRALNLFLDAISELLRPSRLSVLVRNPTTREFEIRAHRGLRPRVAENIRLRADEGLPLWLMTEARIIHRSEVESRLRSPAYLEIHREMQALSSVASIPLMTAGTLLGILNLGERITGIPYTDDDLEILFSLASQVAIAIQDINLYHELQYQKMFIENILTHMSSGVITIGTDEKIHIFNDRAAEILGQSPTEVLHEDLRTIPSPLGDLLYETLRDGVAYRKHEVLLAAGNRPLEVSTYQIFDEQRRPSGSVMVFEDITSQKQLYEERRRADRLDFLNKVVGRMAHEIKNPLVSIKTFVELLDGRYDDPDFRKHFRSIMEHDVHSLNEITEKLLNFASKISYRFIYGDVNIAIRDCISSILPEASYPLDHRFESQQGENAFIPDTSNIHVVCDDSIPQIRFDPEQFKNALNNLLVYLIQSMDKDGNISISTFFDTSTSDKKYISVKLIGKECHRSTIELQQLFDPFSTEQSILIDVGPCVAQKIIEEHGGYIDVHHAKNGEIAFVIMLPV